MVKKPYIIAEAGINHNGNYRIAEKLIKKAKECGADCIKFQYIIADEMYVEKKHKFYSIFKNVELSQADFYKLKKIAQSAKIDFMMTVPSVEALRRSMALKISRIKIGSSNLTNTILLRALAKYKAKIRIYLSTGMGDISEVDTALKDLGYSAKNSDKYSLFHCTSNYPANYSDLNLRAIRVLRTLYSNLSIGYSDHTIGSLAAITAASCGAEIFEKHFTLDNKMKGEDHFFSSNPADLIKYISDIKHTILALGELSKQKIKSEQGPAKRSRRFLILGTEVRKGEKFQIEQFKTKRVADVKHKVAVNYIDAILKLRAPKDYKKNQPLDWRDF